MNKRILSVLLALTMVISLTISAFAAPSVSTQTVTSFNNSVSISNVIKTGDINTDKSFDRAKTDKALEVSDKDRSVKNNNELYYCAAAPVTITLKKMDDDNYGITKLACYNIDEASTPKFDIEHYPVYVIDNDKPLAACSGTITLKKPGSYYLYLTNSSSDIGIYIVVGGVSSTATAKITGINLSKTATTLAKGKSITLTATIVPTNATNKTVTWTSSNTKIVTVNANGKVTAKAKGTATITCKATDGSGKTATCKVTVK